MRCGVRSQYTRRFPAGAGEAETVDSTGLAMGRWGQGGRGVWRRLEAWIADGRMNMDRRGRVGGFGVGDGCTDRGLWSEKEGELAWNWTEDGGIWGRFRGRGTDWGGRRDFLRGERKRLAIRFMFWEGAPMKRLLA